MILLNKPDADALQRLYSPRLLPATLSLGQLFIKNIKKNIITLNQNVHYQGNKSFINQCTIICGNDKKPIISYSLNKYDMITLYAKKDLEYANRSLLKNSNVLPLSTDRYFISLAPKSTELRSYLKKVIIPLEIQKNAVKAEGELISTIESSDQKQTPEKRDPNIKKPSDIESIRILYNSDDPISMSIAEKIFSDLSNSGISSKLVGLTVHKVQNALIDRNYDIAIGWVSDRIITDESEKLRLAAIWFNGENNEAKRISENFEIPLFAIKKYALCKKHIKFYKNRLTGIFRQD
jgi:MarR-like DNA-binding transcriptional regulator SgrR of sgrS sRNA